MTFDEVVQVYTGTRPRNGARSVKCLCPAHKDKQESLSITDAGDRVLIYCHAGCDTEAVLTAKGLTFADICPNKAEKDWQEKLLHSAKHWRKPVITNLIPETLRIVDVYDYRDENGGYLYSKVRFEGSTKPDGRRAKSMRYFRINYAENRYDFGDGGIPHVLYQLPALKAAGEKETVYYVEGEKDVLTLFKRGMIATTSGGVKDWNPEYAKYFTGHNVVILPDNDAAGEQHAQKVCGDLLPMAKSVKIVKTSQADKGDVTDYLEKEGGTTESLLELIDTAERVTAKQDLGKFHKWSKPDASGMSHPTDTKDDVIAETLIDSTYMFIMGGKIYFYSGGVYRLDKDGGVTKTRIGAYIYEELRNITRIDRIYKLILTKQSIQKTDEQKNNFPSTWINFRNCFLDVRTMETHEHSPTYIVLNQIPHEYHGGEVDADSVSMQFLKGAIPAADDLEMFLEFAGYCMTFDTSMQKLLILRGQGATGKSEMIDMIRRMVGTENISNLTIQNFSGGDRFSSAYLQGKLLNYYADLPSQNMDDISILKTITGEDIVRGEWKGGEIFFFKPYAKLLFSANRIPKSKDDATTAYYRRLLILPVMKRGEFIENLRERLKGDVQNLILASVAAAHRMYERGIILESENSKQEVLTLYKDSDSVQAFLLDCTKQDAAGFESRKDLIDAYTSYCTSEGRQAKQVINFYAALREKGYRDGKQDNGRTRGFRGIRFRLDEKDGTSQGVKVSRRCPEGVPNSGETDGFMTLEADEESPFDTDALPDDIPF